MPGSSQDLQLWRSDPFLQHGGALSPLPACSLTSWFDFPSFGMGLMQPDMK